MVDSYGFIRKPGPIRLIFFFPTCVWQLTLRHFDDQLKHSMVMVEQVYDAQMLHGAGISTNIDPINDPNVGKYTIHGA